MEITKIEKWIDSYGMVAIVLSIIFAVATASKVMLGLIFFFGIIYNVILFRISKKEGTIRDFFQQKFYALAGGGLIVLILFAMIHFELY